MARQVLTLGGALIGAYFGAPQLGFFLGSLVGNAVDPVKIEGPRLTDAKSMTARDGVPIPWGDGIFRVAGTMIACQPGKPTEHKKKKRQGKGGGPVQVTYTYTRSHAVLVCEGPIIGIRRIWRNGKLVYDQTPLPTSADEPDPTKLTDRIKQAIKSKASGKKFSQQLTIYLGSETQLPDPTLEAIFGAGEVGANRGMAYVVIEDDDVTDTGGAVPQYEFEVARAGVSAEDDYIKGLGPAFYYKLNGDGVDTMGNLANLVPGGSYAWGGLGIDFTGTSGHASVSQGTGLDGVADYTVLVRCKVNSLSGGSVYKSIVSHVTNSLAGWNTFAIYLRGANKMTPVIEVNNGSGGGLVLSAGFEVAVGEEFLVGFRRTGTTVDLLFDGAVITSGTSGGTFGGTATFTVGGGRFYPSSYGLVGEVSHVVGYARALTDAEIASMATYFQLDGVTRYTLPDSTEYYVDAQGNVTVTNLGVGETIAEDTPSVADMISTICLRCGLEAGDIDVTDVSAIDLTGYVIARPADGSACLNPLLDAFQVGMFEADGKIHFVQLGADTVADIDADDLVAQQGPPVNEVRSQEVEIPRKINVLYADPATAYTVTKQTSERTASTVSAVGERNIELPVVMTADQAAQIAHKKEKAAWIDLLGGKDFALPDAFSYLTPTDNINLTYRGRTERLRIEKVDGEGGKLMLSTRQDRQAAYSSDRTGTNPGDFIVADTLVGPTIWNVMNLPQLRPQDNVPGVYFACTGILEGWRGCELQMSVDSGVSWISMLQVDQPNAIGYVETAMLSGDTTARVTMFGTNELESVTTAQVTSGSNRAAIVTSADVCELVSFEDATLDTGTTYDLATMTRGLLQTTAAAHAVNERFVQLDSVNFVPIPLEFAGDTIIFRAVSLGTIESNNGEQTLVFSPGIQVIDGGGA